jgi:large subunit ribosomal protein L9e
MRQVKSTRTVAVPADVQIWIKARRVRVKGPRGVLEKSFKQIKVELELQKKGKEVLCTMWFGNRKGLACIRTVCAHIQNMIDGVTKGFEYKMRMVYAHFPINVNVEEQGTLVEVRNFIGQKVLRKVSMMEGVTCVRGEDVKDQLILSGNSLDNVSQSAANIQQCVRVCDKDIRKFLDGIYVSERGNIVKEE